MQSFSWRVYILVLALLAGRRPSRAFVSPNFAQTRRNPTLSLSQPEESSRPSSDALKGLDVAVVGAGPSGLLLAHKLLAAGARVSVFESRPRPHREASKEPRAYALGVGMRGRTAIRSVDEPLWDRVRSAGFPSERFIVHAGPFRLKLRDGGDGDRDGEGDEDPEPSVLLYQTDLCRVMAEELESRWEDSVLSLSYDAKVAHIDLRSRALETGDGEKQFFDLVVGCDGANSAVRSAIEKNWPSFQSTKKELPGELKVVRLPSMPPKMDPTAVALLLPKAGACTAFVEPTGDGGCCILFAGSNSTDPLLASSDADELKRIILGRFPLLEGAPVELAASQLAAIKTSRAASVVCNTYHYGSAAVLVGDAAHATGGVSGQGVNSALMDSKVLAECLVSKYEPSKKFASVQEALLNYSQQQVPEGKALYDLSFGPKPTSLWQKIEFSLSNLRDSVFRGRLGIGKLPLQTMLTTSLTPFAEIRKQRGHYYGEEFPSAEEWNEKLASLDASAKQSITA